MAQWNNVHLMFCEGPHDAAFLKLIIKTMLGFNSVPLKLSDLPYPLNDIFKKSFEVRAAEDFRLDLAKKFFLPEYLLCHGNSLVLIFNYGGANRQRSMEPFLDKVFTLRSVTAFSKNAEPVSHPNYKYMIFADADADGRENARSKISHDLSLIDGVKWLADEWTACINTKAATQETDVGPTAAYIWSKWEEDTGTLEDIVYSCVSNTVGLEQTLAFIDDRFEWEPVEGATPSQVCASTAKRLKAALCVEGQRKKPGGSLGVVLDQAGLIDARTIETSREAQDCVLFLRGWLAE
ncbi:hypothetical protein ACK3ZB_10675 [Aeromonas caviae]